MQRYLFFTGLALNLFALLVIAALPSTGLEALGGVLVAYFSWLFHLLALAVVLCLFWRARATFFSIFVLSYFLLVSLFGATVAFVGSGADTKVLEAIESYTDASGYELRDLSEQLHIRAMREQPSNPEIIRRIETLLADKPELNRRGETAAAPLWSLAAAGQTELVRALIKAGAMVDDARLYESSPLFIAASNGHTETVAALIELGADLNAVYRNHTPLMIALRNGHSEAAAMLIHAGADPNIQTSEANAFGIALTRSDVAMVELLLKTGTEPILPFHNKAAILFAYERGEDEIVALLINFAEGWDEQHESNLPPLLYFYGQCDLPAFQLALSQGANPDLLVTRFGHAILIHLVTQFSQQCNSDAFVDALLAAGADAKVSNESGLTALVLALSKQRITVAEALIDSGASCDAYDSLKDSVLSLALRHNASDLVHYCLEQGSDPNYRSPFDNGSFPLFEAVKRDDHALVRILIRNGAELPTQLLDIQRLFSRLKSAQVAEQLIELYMAGDMSENITTAVRRGVVVSELADKRLVLDQLQN